MTMTIPDEAPQREIAEPPVATRRSGSAALVFLVALAVIAAIVGFMLLGRVQAQPYILPLLGVLAAVGLFMAFALAAGVVQFADRSANDPIIRKVADGAFDGVVVTDQRGHIVYANPAYLALTGAANLAEARSVERVFIGDPEVSETVYRLLKAAREGRRQQEEMRVAGADGNQARWLRMRVQPLGESRKEQRFAVWSIADITRDRA